MIQIFGTLKNFDVKTAQRWFAERRIPVQFVDLKENSIRPVKARSAQGLDSSVCRVSEKHKPGMSRGEFDNVVDLLAKEYGSRDAAIDALIDKKSRDYASIAYLGDSEKADKLFENAYNRKAVKKKLPVASFLGLSKERLARFIEPLKLMKQPVCRNGKNAATVGLAQKTWETWK